MSAIIHPPIDRQRSQEKEQLGISERAMAFALR
jgi:hypothetical protein